jgi:hypothetical protein
MEDVGTPFVEAKRERASEREKLIKQIYALSSDKKVQYNKKE